MSAITKPPRINHLDFFRAVSILAVVTIHSTSQPVSLFLKSSWQYNYYHFWNAASIFAVPSFLFLCSLVLFYNYSNNERLSSWIAGFYKKRLLYILLPYILWSFIYFIFRNLSAPQRIIGDLPLYFDRLLTGTNHTHLYYFTIIIQLYLLFPLLLWLTRFIWIRRLMLPLGIVIHIVFYYCNTNYWHINRTASLLPTYWMQITLGAWIGMYFDVIMNQLRRHKWLIGAIGVASALTYIYGYGLNVGSYKRAYHFFIYNLFTLSASVCLLLFSHFLFNWPHAEKIKKFISSVGFESFGIFLIHPLVLALWRKFVMPNIFSYHLGIWLGGAAAVLIAWLITLVIRRFSIGWILIGK